MTKHYPAVCLAHPKILIYNKNGVVRHRNYYNCYEDVVSIFSKRYKRVIKKESVN